MKKTLAGGTMTNPL